MNPNPYNQNQQQNPYEPITIRGINPDEVGKPSRSGTPGSALYNVPIRLNRYPLEEWKNDFVAAWNSPSQFSTMHRPGIASVSGDRIILTGTTIEEVRDYHAATVKNAVDAANAKQTEKYRKYLAAKEAQMTTTAHDMNVKAVVSQIKF